MILINEQKLEQLLAPDGQIYIAFSGGLDSLVLLHCLAKSLPATLHSKLHAIHVHHGLSANADAWASHCQQVCMALNIDFITEYVEVSRDGSVEENARKARYEAFAKYVASGDLLLLGHHANDQAETLLFRLERGAGTRGLQGIPETRMIGDGMLWRPLLRYCRSELEQYAKSQGLEWVEDESNTDSSFRRNFLRHEVMAPWQSNNPNIAREIASSASLMQQEMSVYERLACEAMFDYLTQCGGLILSKLPAEEEFFWLSRFLRQSNISLTKPQLEAVVVMFASSKEKRPYYRGNGFDLSRFEDVLYMLPKMEAPSEQTLIAGVWCNRAYDSIHCDRPVALKGRPQSIDLLLPNGRHRPLKKWLQDQRIPLWWRDQLPYIFENDVLVAIGDLWQLPSWKGEVKWHSNGTLPWPKLSA